MGGLLFTIDPVLGRLEVVPGPQLGVDDGRRHGRRRRLHLEVLEIVDDMRRPSELHHPQQERHPQACPSAPPSVRSHLSHSRTLAHSSSSS